VSADGCWLYISANASKTTSKSLLVGAGLLLLRVVGGTDTTRNSLTFVNLTAIAYR